MPSIGRDLSDRQAAGAEESAPVRLMKLVASVALTLLIVAVLALIGAPKDLGTLTLYGLVIGLNLLICLVTWPVVRWLQRVTQ